MARIKKPVLVGYLFPLDIHISASVHCEDILLNIFINKGQESGSYQGRGAVMLSGNRGAWLRNFNEKLPWKLNTRRR